MIALCAMMSVVVCANDRGRQLHHMAKRGVPSEPAHKAASTPTAAPLSPEQRCNESCMKLLRNEGVCRMRCKPSPAHAAQQTPSQSGEHDQKEQHDAFCIRRCMASLHNVAVSVLFRFSSCFRSCAPPFAPPPSHVLRTRASLPLPHVSALSAAFRSLSFEELTAFFPQQCEQRCGHTLASVVRSPVVAK